MENNYENAPQEETQSTQPAPQNEESTNSEYSNSNENMNQNYQYSYGNNEYQPNGHDNQNGSNQYNQPDKSVMSMGDWLITLLALLIPCAGIILYFVWAFGKNENENRKNYCRAYLIYWAITTVLGIIVFIFFGAMIFNMISGSGYYGYY